MIYGYIRVSSDKQTVENQRFEINNFCERNSITIDGWIEETISGTKAYNKRQLVAHYSSINLIKRASVFLSTLQILAIFLRDIPIDNNSEIKHLFPYNFNFSTGVFFPAGRPNVIPSAFLRARASFVLWLIRFRSISAESPKANANTLL